jgi:hypothetical protein
MQASLQTASNSLPAVNGVFAQSQRRDNLTYQVMTIVAILVLLCSLGVF